MDLQFYITLKQTVFESKGDFDNFLSMLLITLSMLRCIMNNTMQSFFFEALYMNEEERSIHMDYSNIGLLSIGGCYIN